MKLVTVNEVNGMRGFEALTQRKMENISLLVDNVNSLGGKKALGFSKTRKHFLTNEFDRQALEEMTDIAIELKNSIGDKTADKFVRLLMKQLLERVFRDHVALDMTHEFRLAIAQRVELSGSIVKAIKGMEDYFTSGHVVPVAESYRHACKELEEGKVIYLDPKTKAI